MAADASPSFNWGGGDPFASPWASDPTPPPPPVASTSGRPAAEEDTWDAESNDGLAAPDALISRALARDLSGSSDDRDTFDDADDGFPGAAEGEDDDFGDFGDFNDGAEAFPAAAPSMAAPPMLRPDMPIEEMTPFLVALFDRVFPFARQELLHEPERQVGGPAQVLENEQCRHLFAQLCEPPPVRPVDWKRSRTRREHLIALGVPVNLDELAAPDARLLPPLVTSVPRRASPASAPVNGSASSRPSSRASVPVVKPIARTPPPPPIDRERAKELLGMSEEQLALLPLVRLEALRGELQGLASDASAGLTRALEKREALTSTGEAYDAKIQELVMAAQRLKPSPATAANDLKRSGSAKSSMWRPNRSASPASGGSGRAIR